MYDDVVTSDGDSDDFVIKIGLHKGSALSPYPFVLVMDKGHNGYTRNPMVYALCG